ncbi:MAG: glycosyltransferase family 9 protein [Thermodesulfobacteriota bacterium]
MHLNEQRVLIIKPSSLGDVVHTVPLVHAIKRCRPDCTIGWVIQKSFRPVIQHDPAVDEIIPISIPSTSEPAARGSAWFAALAATFRTFRTLRTQFKAVPYDLVLDLHASFRSGLLGLTNPAGRRVGFADAKELNTWFQHTTLTTDANRPHAVDKNMAFAGFLGCRPQPEDYRLVTGSEAHQKVTEFLKAEGVNESDRLVYANPAARWKTKLWTIDAWTELADLLTRRTGAQVVFGGGPGDLGLIREITGRMQQLSILAAGRLALDEAVALIERCDVYVGVDSGPMHIAAFVGTPVVAVFGPTDPAKVGPYGDGHRVIRLEELDCLACRKRSCVERRCLEELPASRVFEETAALMGW